MNIVPQIEVREEQTGEKGDMERITKSYSFSIFYGPQEAVYEKGKGSKENWQSCAQLLSVSFVQILYVRCLL